MPVKQTPIFVLCLFASTLAWSQDDVRIVKPSPRVKSDPIVPVGYVVSADNPTPTGRQLAPLRLNLAERDMNHGESLLARFEANEDNVLPPAQDTKPAAKPSSAGTKTLSEKDVEKLVADALKKKDEEKKKEDEKKKKEAEEEKKKKAEDDKKKKEEDEAKKKKEEEDKRLNELYGGTRFDLYNLYDSLTRPSSSSKKWYEKLSIRGYTQVRFTKTLETDAGSAQPNLFGDRSVNGQSEDFSLRRVRLIFFGDVGDHLGIYIQPDFASTPQGSTNATFFGQLRDAYGDVYIDKEKVHRIRAGLSKVPYGFENMQSSQNRVALDRTDAINTGVSPNERDLGLFYYWTPVEQQKLFKTLVDSGLKGSGNYGVFGVGVYNGQGGSQFELNDNVHTVARFTYPFQLENAQVVEMSVQGYTGYSVTNGAAIRPLGSGSIITPANTGGREGILDQRVAGTFVWYPQPFGFQAEWQVGRGPGLNDAQTAVESRHLYGGYVQTMYRHDTCDYGIVTPYVRYQSFVGGYRSQANAPFGYQRELDIGVEWQIRKEVELVCEYSMANTPNFSASTADGVKPYRDFEGDVLRFQLQLNY